MGSYAQKSAILAPILPDIRFFVTFRILKLETSTTTQMKALDPLFLIFITLEGYLVMIQTDGKREQTEHSMLYDIENVSFKIVRKKHHVRPRSFSQETMQI